jgi:Kelch motif/Galactose oxidase, central domain
MTTKRSAHTAARLANGKVLIAGGGNGSAFFTAEIFDPATGTFTPTGNMHVGRFFFTATLLRNGRVLVAGGICDNHGCTGAGTSSAELYNPATGTFALTGSMSVVRSAHTATLLTDGTVLVTGGSTSTGVTATAELFDPSTRVFTPTASMQSKRELHTATRLTNGTVLVTGGINGSITLSSAELFEPTTGSFMPTGHMKTVRAEHAANLLGNGDVLITGGINSNNGALDSLATTELFH